MFMSTDDKHSYTNKTEIWTDMMLGKEIYVKYTLNLGKKSVKITIMRRNNESKSIKMIFFVSFPLNLGGYTIKG